MEIMFSQPVNIALQFGEYLLVMFVYLGIAVGLHEGGHILFAKVNHLDYKILFEKGNIRIAADWERLGKKKVYGNILGIVFGLLPVLIAGWLYFTPVFLLLYLLSCYDDFAAIAIALHDL